MAYTAVLSSACTACGAAFPGLLACRVPTAQSHPQSTYHEKTCHLFCRERGKTCVRFFPRRIEPC